MRSPNRKFAIPNIEANRELIEFLWRSKYNVHCPGPSMCDRPDTYFTFTINQSGYVGNKRDISSGKLYERNERGEYEPFAVVNTQH